MNEFQYDFSKTLEAESNLGLLLPCYLVMQAPRSPQEEWE
jgi:hypothetical protein